MIRNKFNRSKWFVFVVVGTIPFIDSAFGQTAVKQKGVAQATPICSVVNARSYQSAPVTIYKKVGQYSLVTWNTLSCFQCDEPDEIDEYGRLKHHAKKKYPVPDFITALNTAPVAVVGFMLPMDMDDKGDKTTGFIIARTQSSCCYGIMPKLNEWIYVHMQKGTAVDVMMDIPVTTFGTLEVGEKNEEGNGWSLYRMTGDKVGYPKESIW
jgi:hypothetical protein